MYKELLFFIFLFFIFHYLFISGVKNDTINIFAQNMTNQTEYLNITRIISYKDKTLSPGYIT